MAGAAHLTEVGRDAVAHRPAAHVVDLAVELTNMIMSQRSFEANERTIETARDMYQAALQIGK